jgi:hypothetical protein
MKENEQTQAESASSAPLKGAGSGLRTWLNVGAVAAVSALAGGLAAAWYYRKTLRTLQEAEACGGNPEIPVPDSETEFDI